MVNLPAFSSLATFEGHRAVHIGFRRDLRRLAFEVLEPIQVDRGGMKTGHCFLFGARAVKYLDLLLDDGLL